MRRSLLEAALGMVASACGHGKAAGASHAPGGGAAAENVGAANGDGLFETSFARFKMPEGWSLSKRHSRSDHAVLIQSGSDKHRSSVYHIQMSHGTCPYSTDGVGDFAHAILHQLATHHPEISGLAASGYTRNDGTRILKYRIESAEGIYTQFYVVGDKEFVLVTEVVSAGCPDDMVASTTIDEATATIVNSCIIR